jgi:protein-disulfide isomerase
MSLTTWISRLDTLTTRKGALGGAAALFALGIAATVGSAPAVSTNGAAAGAFNPDQTKAIEKIVKEYLLNNPEILIEVGKELEKRQSAMQAVEHKRLIVEQKAAIFAAPTDFVMGNPKGDVTVVEFFDYNCGWCKRAVDEISKLTAADPKVRVVFKEFPIFGENSAIAAKAAMASKKQGKYWDFHVALMKERQVTKDNVFKIAEKIGLDVNKLKADMADPAYDAAIKSTTEIAQGLGIEGTPGFIVDAKVNVGYLPADGLQQLIAEARKTGCQVC